MTESVKKPIPQAKIEDFETLVSIKQFATYIERSEARVRAIMNGDTCPKPVKYGKYIASGREASQYSLGALLEYYQKSIRKRKPRESKKNVVEINVARLW